jgi:putative serine protease PepD
MTEVPPNGSANDDVVQGSDELISSESMETSVPVEIDQEVVSSDAHEVSIRQPQESSDASLEIVEPVPEPTTYIDDELHGQPNAPTWVYQPPQSAPTFESSTQPSRAVRLAVIAGVVSGLLSGIGGYTVASYNAWSPQGAITLPTATGAGSVRASDSIAGLAKAVLPTVVSIEVTSLQGSGTGSGFIIRSSATESYILTNNHVATGAGANANIAVQFQDQSQNKATIVGTDPSYDLAVLKVARGDLPVAQLGDSSDVVVGDLSIAIGSPLGLTGTVTSGIVSALNRPVTAGGEGAASFINAIQTDAAINPGNSGGPLINASGQVVGVNSAIATLGNSSLGSQTGSIGLGFAIPMNQARRVAQEIMNTGTSSHPVIGAELDVNYQGVGARIAGIVAGGPASKTSLKVGDVIRAIDGQQVKDGSELIVRIRAHMAGDIVTLSRQSGDDVRVTLKSSMAK